jgi:hypothetical protein
MEPPAANVRHWTWSSASIALRLVGDGTGAVALAMVLAR